VREQRFRASGWQDLASALVRRAPIDAIISIGDGNNQISGGMT
jgi:hypothetical protein